jgi:hypothetical protein
MKTTHRVLGIGLVVFIATLVLAAVAGATHYYIQDGAPTSTWGLTGNAGWENMTTTAPTNATGPVDYFQLGAYYAGTAAMTVGQGQYVCLQPMKAEIWFKNKVASITNTITVKLQRGTFGTAGTTLATATASVTSTSWAKKTFDFGYLGISLNNESLILEITCAGSPLDCDISWAGTDHPSALLWGAYYWDSIYDIQNGTIPPGQPVQVGCAIVTVAPYEYTSTGAYCFVMAPDGGPYSGVEVYWGSAKASIYGGLQRGDGVYITGITGEYYDMTEIDMSGHDDTLIVGSSGNALPGPDVISIGDAFDEAWEGVLVRLNCTEVYDLFDYGEWGIHDAAGDQGRVDDKGQITYSPFIGDWKDLVGILAYSYGNYVLWPRDDADIIETGPTAVEPTSWGNIKRLYR